MKKKYYWIIGITGLVIFLIASILILSCFVMGGIPGRSLCFFDLLNPQKIIVSFREFCISWSMSDFTENPVLVGGNQVKVEDQCGFALGKSDLTDNDIENCKDMCRTKL